MTTFADIDLRPGGVASIVAWVAVGLIAGWLATRIMRDHGSSVFFDIVLGLLGALLGGFLFGFLVQTDTGIGGDTGFWGSVAIACLGACVVIIGTRLLRYARRA
jgi:uncharacterized membrane protein YeaQ/YmgE (transglycosylase-associated protein family)